MSRAIYLFFPKGSIITLFYTYGGVVMLHSINELLGSVLFFDIFFGLIPNTKVPFLVAWLIFGAFYFTFRLGFPNLRFAKHAFEVMIGKWRTKDDVGAISPFQSLTTALSATVGLGNIAGVAVAVMIGGAGATFWMVVAGLFNMTLKFTEVTLSLHYRTILSDGSILGGGMRYLSVGLKEKGFETLGKVLAIIFAFFMLGGALGGGCAFQLSQALGALKSQVGFFESYPWVFGLIMATITGAVIIGGVNSIAKVTEKVVPFMVFLYLSASLYILISSYELIPHAFSVIFEQAFSPTAVEGGIAGVIVQGFKRAAFSSEAGVGSAPNAHAAASVKYPVRQGMVALYEPFIDTVIVCTMTALVIVVTGVYQGGNEALDAIIEAKQGAALTSYAFGSVVSWFPTILTISVILFAFSTMISWSYYGDRAWSYLFGARSGLIFKLLFVATILYASTVEKLGEIIELSDLLLLSMALPNLIGLYILQDRVIAALKDYNKGLKEGTFEAERIKD